MKINDTIFGSPKMAARPKRVCFSWLELMSKAAFYVRGPSGIQRSDTGIRLVIRVIRDVYATFRTTPISMVYMWVFEGRPKMMSTSTQRYGNFCWAMTRFLLGGHGHGHAEYRCSCCLTTFALLYLDTTSWR